METRNEIATELLRGCPEDLCEDHETIAQALRDGAPTVDILDMPEVDRWPDTYVWLRSELDDR